MVKGPDDKTGLRPEKEPFPDEIELILKASDLVSYDTGGVAGVTVGARIDTEWHKLILDIITVGKRVGQFPSNHTEFVRNAIVLYAKVLLQAGVLEEGTQLLDIKRRIENEDFRRKQETGRRRRIEMEQFADDAVDEVYTCTRRRHYATAVDRLTNFLAAMRLYKELEPELYQDVIDRLCKNRSFTDALEELEREGHKIEVPGVNDKARGSGPSVHSV